MVLLGVGLSCPESAPRVPCHSGSSRARRRLFLFTLLLLFPPLCPSTWSQHPLGPSSPAQNVTSLWPPGTSFHGKFIAHAEPQGLQEYLLAAPQNCSLHAPPGRIEAERD